ncbi:hypothetical protein BU26DRAFT_405681, partial [Trematosphaeria pertusa]
IAVAAERTCYGLDGTQLSDEYGPCNPEAKHSGCCAIHRPAGSVDVCLDNGLCMATNGGFVGTIWQDGCTDPTGTDSGCPKMCPDENDGFAGLNKVLAWNIQTCDFGIYCCRAVDDNANCCANSTAPRITTNAIGAFKFETSTAGASPATATASAANTATQVVFGTAVSTGTPSTLTPSQVGSASTAAPDLCASAKRKTAIVGGALGSILGAALLGALGVIVWMHGKEKRQRRLKEHYETQFGKS